MKLKTKLFTLCILIIYTLIISSCTSRSAQKQKELQNTVETAETVTQPNNVYIINDEFSIHAEPVTTSNSENDISYVLYRYGSRTNINSFHSVRHKNRTDLVEYLLWAYKDDHPTQFEF